MGCVNCVGYEFSNGSVELVHGDNRLLIKERPRTINDLVEQVLSFDKHFEKPSDFTLEYITYEGVKPISHEVSLQEAYMNYQDSKLIIGVRASFGDSSCTSTLESVNS